MAKIKNSRLKKTDNNEICSQCKRPAHKPGMSEYSNCGEGDIVHSRYEEQETFHQKEYLDDYIALEDTEY